MVRLLYDGLYRASILAYTPHVKTLLPALSVGSGKVYDVLVVSLATPPRTTTYLAVPCVYPLLQGQPQDAAAFHL